MNLLSFFTRVNKSGWFYVLVVLFLFLLSFVRSSSRASRKACSSSSEEVRFDQSVWIKLMIRVIVTFLIFDSICFCLIKYRKLKRVFYDQRYLLPLGAQYMQAIMTGFLIKGLVFSQSLKVDGINALPAISMDVTFVKKYCSCRNIFS